jgi:hypothetical protein
LTRFNINLTRPGWLEHTKIDFRVIVSFSRSVLVGKQKMSTGLALNRCSVSVCRTAVTLLNRPTVSVARSLKFSRRLIGNCSIAPADPYVVADDDKYGNKQVISLTPRLYDYVLSNVREPKILRQLREETSKMRGSQMQVTVSLDSSC